MLYRPNTGNGVESKGGSFYEQSTTGKQDERRE